MRSALVVAKASENGKWKTDKPCGNLKRNAYYVCKEHVDCGRKMRVSKVGENFEIFYKGKHSAIPTHGPRKNSSISWEQPGVVTGGLRRRV